MTDKEFHKLGRRELLQLLLAQAKEADELRGQLTETTEQLHQLEENYERLRKRLDQKDEQIHKLRDSLQAEKKKREIELADAGSIAEASLRLNGIFEAAQRAADQYLHNIRLLQGEQMAGYVNQEPVLTRTLHLPEEPEGSRAYVSRMPVMTIVDVPQDAVRSIPDERENPDTGAADGLQTAKAAIPNELKKPEKTTDVPQEPLRNTADVPKEPVKNVVNIPQKPVKNLVNAIYAETAQRTPPPSIDTEGNTSGTAAARTGMAKTGGNTGLTAPVGRQTAAVKEEPSRPVEPIQTETPAAASAPEEIPDTEAEKKADGDSEETRVVEVVEVRLDPQGRTGKPYWPEVEDEPEIPEWADNVPKSKVPLPKDKVKLSRTLPAGRQARIRNFRLR